MTRPPGRRLRCRGCAERVRQEDAFDHFEACGSAIVRQYSPDRLDTDETTLEDFA